MMMVDWEDEHPTQRSLRAVTPTPPPLRLAPEFGNPPPPSSMMPATTPRGADSPASMPDANELGKRPRDEEGAVSEGESGTDKMASRQKLSPPQRPGDAGEARGKTGEETTSLTPAKLPPPDAMGDGGDEPTDAKLSPPKLPSSEETAPETTGEEPPNAEVAPPKLPSSDAPAVAKTGEEPTTTGLVPPKLPRPEALAVEKTGEEPTSPGLLSAKLPPPEAMAIKKTSDEPARTKLAPPKLPAPEEMAIRKAGPGPTGAKLAPPKLPPPEEMAVKKSSEASPRTRLQPPKLPPPEKMAVKKTGEEPTSVTAAPARQDLLHVPAPPPIPFATVVSKPASSIPPSSAPISLIESAPLPLVPIALSYEDERTVVREKREPIEDDDSAAVVHDGESEERRRERAQTLAAALRDAARWRQRAIVLGWCTLVLAVALLVLGIASFGG